MKQREKVNSHETKPPRRSPHGSYGERPRTLSADGSTARRAGGIGLTVADRDQRAVQDLLDLAER